MVFNLQATAGTPGAYIPPSKLPAIQAAALAACDAADGVKDDVIENPGACRTSPDLLLCRGAESDACLTAPQVRALEKLYDGTRDAKGRLLFPGYAPGGEADPAGWRLWITGPSPDNSLLFAFSSGFFRNMIFHDLAWDYKQFSVDRRAHSVDRKLGAVLNATDPDLKRFQERGGKLILYHGWSDAAIPPENTIDYYESVARKMGASRASSFVRLFMVPGMQHCYGGAGPSSFGQLGVALGDATHNIASALEQWVEQGKAPEQIVATKYKNRTDPASGIERTRPLCAYPKTARYKGTGSTDDASNFECVAPARQAKSAR
jgi:feruloyl esterase